MATYTENYLLKKPNENDYYNIDDFNGNSDIIDSELEKRVEIPNDFSAGNIPVFSSSGNLADSGKSVSDFLYSNLNYEDIGAEKSGEALKVQQNLSTHISDSSKHLTESISGKIAKMHTTDTIVISSSMPPIKEGTVWIKVV